MKAFLIKWLLEAAFDEILKALEKFAHRSSSKVDDKIVRLFKKERNEIIKEIKKSI